MKIKFIKAFTLLIAIFAASNLLAHIDPKRLSGKPKQDSDVIKSRIDCTISNTETDLQVNNVRARLQTGGDIWWDRSNGRYIVPKVSNSDDEVSSIFAGGVWIGGRDQAGNLKLAASTFTRASEVDFFPGPLKAVLDPNDPNDIIVDKTVCADWDKFFKVDGEAIRRAVALYDFDPASFECDSVTDDVRYFPGKGNPYWLEEYKFELPNTGQGLGSFFDNDEDGIYDPCAGDFPIIDIRGCEPVTDTGEPDRKKARELIPDELIFWIYNDAGNSHTNSQGDAIRMEVQAQAFAYATNDEINDMTFIRYKLINRAEANIQDCYFAMWVDPDLGCYNDDYIGCDVDRSLAYVYNEDAIDGFSGETCPGGVNTYGTRVPILGVDYFRGPLSPKYIEVDSSSVDSLGMTVYDTIYITPEIGSTIAPDTFLEEGMTSFVYTNNPSVGNPDPITTDPLIDEDYYQLLLGNWRTGDAITYGTDGLNSASTDTVKYVFPDNPSNTSTEAWSMCTEELPFGDRRTLQATGPLLLRPNDINELIVGVVWVPNQAYPCPDITELQFADDLAQALFDNCFDITDGPDAPDACFVELDQEIIMILSNEESIFLTNNPNEQYQEVDLLAPEGVEDPFYRFEGYLIYQLENASVSTQEFDDPEQAKLVRQVDVKNGVSILYNYTPEVDPLTGVTVFNREDKVENASDDGIRHTFSITSDAFADGDTRLVNHQAYYFSVVAYAYNEYEQFKVDDGVGQRKPYLEGRQNIQTYTVVPRPIVYKNQRAEYGDGPTIIRLDGQGTGNNFLNISEESLQDIINSFDPNTEFNGEITYTPGNGPVNVEIYNPLEVKDASFTLEIMGDFDGSNEACSYLPGARWTLTNDETGEVFTADRDINQVNEQLIVDYGFSISLNQVSEPGTPEALAENNGAIGASVEYADELGAQWILGLGDNAAVINDLGFNQIGNALDYITEESSELIDPDQELVNLGNQFMNPFILADYRPNEQIGFPAFLTPAWVENGYQENLLANGNITIDDLNNVDIVFTSNTDLWSRCVVVERATDLNGFDTNLTPIGNANNFELRESPSINKLGEEDGDGTGMSWFPGYAIDVETGKRLNIFFGENSIYQEGIATETIDFPSNGGDMIFNPSSDLFTEVPNNPDAFYTTFAFGGQHTVYVTRQEYDGCAMLRTEFNKNLFVQKYGAFSQITWAGIMMLGNGAELLSLENGLIPNDVTIKLRVNQPYSPEKVTVFSNDVTENCEVLEGNPTYQLLFEGVEATELENSEYEGALANVNVVPNPYYAFSSYETSQFTNTIKITNLPDRAEVTIFSIDGKFIRQISRDETPANKPAGRGTLQSQTLPNVEWDLQNFAGIPVASGVYIFHINAPDLGESRSIKWFGVNRQFDPTGL